MEKKVRWGIIGTAKIAKNMIAPGIKLAKNAELYGIAGRNKEKTEHFAKEYSIEKVYTNYEDLLNDPMIDAVYIPLPNGLHYEWSIKAMEKGKHVLCEKPLAISTEQIEEMTAVSKTNNVLLAEAFAYRHNPIVLELKRRVKEGEIGKIKSIESNFTFNLKDRNDIRMNKELGGGAIYDVGCYPVHFVRYILESEPQNVGKFVEYDNETGVDISCHALLGFKNNITCVIHCGFNRFYRMDTRIIGDKGILETKTTFNMKGPLEIAYWGKMGRKVYKVHSMDNYLMEIEYFSNAVLNKGKPLITLEDSINNMKVLEKLLRN